MAKGPETTLGKDFGALAQLPEVEKNRELQATIDTVLEQAIDASKAHREVLSASVRLLTTECGYKSRTANHIATYYLRPLVDELSSALRAKSREKDPAKKTTLVKSESEIKERIKTQLFKAATVPEAFGIILDEQDTPRHLILEGKEDYAGEVLGTLQDDYPDPFHVNGQLPMPERLGVELKRMYDILYHDRDADTEEAKQSRVALKEKCVNQLVRELLAAEKLPQKTKDERSARNKAITLVTDRMTQFMHDMLDSEVVKKYIEAINTGVMGEDLVPFATITRRPSYLDLAPNDPLEKSKNIYRFYETLSAKYSEEEKRQLIEAFEQGDKSFFVDEAGTKDVPHIYFDVCTVLKAKGYTQEQIDSSFAPFIKEMTDKMIALKNAVNAEYKKGFNRDVKKINQFKQELGTLRKSFLAEGKKQVEHADILSLISGESVDMNAVLGGEFDVVEELEENQAIEFTCSDFSDRDTRIESQERFYVQLEEALQPLRSSANANALGLNDAFKQISEEYQDAKKRLEMLVRQEGEPDVNAIMDIATKIADLHGSLIAFYAESNGQDDSMLLIE